MLARWKFELSPGNLELWQMEGKQENPVAVGGLWQSLKIRQRGLMHWLTIPFTDDFSVASNADGEHFTHGRTFQASETLLLLELQSSCNIPNPLLPSSNLHRTFAKSRFSLKFETTFFPSHKKELLVN